MTYQNSGDYRLANKLKKEFYGRGYHLSGMQASSTSELMKRAEMGRDPRVNCSEEAFRENYRNRRSGGDGYSAEVNHNGTARKQTAGTSRSTSAKNSNTYNREQTYSSSRKMNAEVEQEKITPAVEMTVKKNHISPVFVTALLLGTVMVMFLVFNISEVYKMTNTITSLETQLSELEAVAEQLELKLEEKNDIREIENIATSKLGMTKEDALQRRYISLSEGEHIDVVEDDTQKDDTANGILLSSIFSALGDFFDRLK
ncbi:MAG: hypothetical protein E7672_09785 [Ruminococcaceae bacterium]|nr:hypothetical protein [Oscillospiraceae bacterium]